MSDADGLRYTKIPLNNGADKIPALGFGTLIPDPIATKEAVRISLEVGFRQFDCAERYRNEEQVGEAMRAVFKEGRVKRKDIFVGTKLWNNNHRPERVRPAFEASLRRLQLDYVDLYSTHTPFAFKAGDEQDPRDKNGNVIYDDAVTLTNTWKALESLVDEGRCKAIGLSNVSLAQLKEVFEIARIKPAVVQVESHPSPRMGSARLLQEKSLGPREPGLCIFRTGPRTGRESRSSGSSAHQSRVLAARGAEDARKLAGSFRTTVPLRLAQGGPEVSRPLVCRSI